MNPELKPFIDSLGLEYKASFVPQSLSRNAGEKYPSLNWRIFLGKKFNPHAREAEMLARGAIATDYMQGIGHLPKDPQTEAHHKGARRDCIMIAGYERKCAESGRYGRFTQKRIPPPELVDVLYSLVTDSDAIDHSFNEWCGTFGYDTDSRKAEETYKTCTELGHKLRNMIGRDNLDKLRELFTDY